jgi:glycosyltransferase involved in cell wall biosynthesis
MKVLMYGWEFPPNFTGGLGIACYGIVHGLLANEVAIALVLPRHPSQPAYSVHCFSQDDALELLSIDHSSFSVTSIHSLLRPYVDVKRYQEELAVTLATTPKKSHRYGDDLLEEVRRYAMIAGKQAEHVAHDVIHAHDWLTVLAGIEARKISKKPLIFQVHALETDRSGKHLNQEIYNIERYGMEQADHIIAVSQYTKNKIIMRYGISDHKISVSYNGLFRQQRPQKNEVVELKNPLKTVLFLGRLTYQKGVFYFIEAARKILENRQDIQFVVSGEGDLLHSAIEHVASLGLGTHIHFTHFLDRASVSKIYHLSEVYVMPSVSEPFGIACLEALEHHVPVIISKQSGVAEVLDSIITVDFWDTHILAQKIMLLIDEPQLKENLLKNIDQKLDQLTWNNLTKNIVKLYQNLSSKEELSFS